MLITSSTGTVSLQVKMMTEKTKHKGAVLLVVLIIVSMITALSLGFLARSNTELACGENTARRRKMNYLAESGLEHAKGLILNPQDVSRAYWSGAAGQQLAAGNDNYYDVNVTKLGPSDYLINTEGYKLKDGEKIASSRLKAQIRLNPCIALWTGGTTTITAQMTVNGDLYCNGDLINQGTISGDVFAENLTGAIQGQQNSPNDLSLTWPRVIPDDFLSHYNYVQTESELSNTTIGPYDPPEISYRSGNLKISGNTIINGMLLVEGDLTISGAGNEIKAGKNLPALLVTGNLIFRKNAHLDVNGLALVHENMLVSAEATEVNVNGALFIKGLLQRTVIDSSGRNNTGIINNCPDWHPYTGKIDGAIEFDGISDYIQTPDSDTKLQISNDYTFSAWLKAAYNQDNWAAVFSKCDTTGTSNHWTLQFNNVSPRKLIIHHANSYWNTGINLGDIAGQWHHIRVVRTETKMQSFLDGLQIHSNSWNEGPGSGNGHLNIGADRTSSDTYLYDGLIDDLRIYNQAPDPNEIYPSSGLIGGWKFDESGTIINVTAEPSSTAVITFADTGEPRKWSQAAGAFYKTIETQ